MQKQLFDIDLEQIVLGSVLIDRDCFQELDGMVCSDTFHLEAHRLVWDAFESLSRSAKGIDVMTLMAEMGKLGTLELLPEGPVTISKLTDGIGSTVHVQQHAMLLVELHLKRQMLEMADSIVTTISDSTVDAFKQLDDMRNKMEMLDQGVTSQRGMVSLTQAAQQKVNELIQIAEGAPPGIPVELIDLGRVIPYLRGGEVTVIAGRPGMGKSALLKNLIRSTTKKGLVSVLFSLEMPASQISARFISEEIQQSEQHMEDKANKAHNGMGQDLFYKNMEVALSKIGATYTKDGQDLVYIYDDSAGGWPLLYRRCNKAHRTFGKKLGAFFFDYTQLIENAQAGRNREQEISSISRGMKKVALALDVPVVAVAQLSRAVETRGGSRRPLLSDLRESGAIEQDADKVIFVYRPEYYGIDQDEDGNPTDGMAELIVAKNRGGVTSTAKARWIGKYTQFTDLDTWSNDSPQLSQSAQFAQAIAPAQDGAGDEDEMPF